jgi:hypothetical protein
MERGRPLGDIAAARCTPSDGGARGDKIYRETMLCLDGRAASTRPVSLQRRGYGAPILSCDGGERNRKGGAMPGETGRPSNPVNRSV